MLANLLLDNYLWIATCTLNVEPISVDFFFLIHENKADDLLSFFVKYVRDRSSFWQIILKWLTVLQRNSWMWSSMITACVCVRDWGCEPPHPSAPGRAPLFIVQEVTWECSSSQLTLNLSSANLSARLEDVLSKVAVSEVFIRRMVGAQISGVTRAQAFFFVKNWKCFRQHLQSKSLKSCH